MPRLIRKIAWVLHQIQNRTRAVKVTAINEYKPARRREKHLIRKKKEQLDDEASIEIERQSSVQDFHKFYKHLSDTRKPFEPGIAMC
jgi:GTP1/Obg family GTP-binding protein